MRNMKMKNSLFVLVSITIVFFFLFAKLQNLIEFSIVEVIKLLPKVVSADLVCIGLFSTFLWKCKVFNKWLVPFPNLNGTWKGHIQTTWVDPETNERPGPIPAILAIKQSFFSISCVMRTAEMNSYSVISDFVLDEDNQIMRLFYSYDSKPLQTVRDRSPEHCGTMSFNIIEKPELTLSGEYWTGRKTTGHIEMTYWKKERLGKYPEELGKHPVSESRKDNS